MSGTVVLAHVESAGLHGGAAQLLRLGPLLALLLVAAWALVERAGTATPSLSRRLGAGAAVTLGAAGAIHLALVGQHANEGLASAAFFAAAGVTELLLAVALWRTPGSRRSALAAGVVAGGLLVLYGVSRRWSIPAFGGQEAIDTLGLLTKLLELVGAVLAAAAARTWSLRPIRPPLLVAAAALAVAFAGQGLFGLGAAPWQVVVVIVLTVGIAVASGASGRPELAMAATDGAVLALLVLATVVLADAQLTPASAIPAALVGVAAGGIDVVLRALGTPYAPLLAVTIALAGIAPFRSISPDAAAEEVAASSAVRPAVGRWAAHQLEYRCAAGAQEPHRQHSATARKTRLRTAV